MIDNRLAPHGIFLLRVALGAMFIAHGLLKYLVFTMPGFEGFVGKIGLPAALAWPIVLAGWWAAPRSLPGFYGRFRLGGAPAGAGTGRSASDTHRP